MADPIIYDKVQYHYSEDYPADVSDEQAFVHAGLYLGWMIEQRLTSARFEAESGDLLRKFLTRELTGPDVYASWEGVLSSDMLSDEGNAFSQYYFDFETGRFLADYHECLARTLPSLYHVEDSWENYVALKQLLDQRLAAWRSGPAPDTPPPQPEAATGKRKSRWWPFR